jgi:DNA polymerase kappa
MSGPCDGDLASSAVGTTFNDDSCDPPRYPSAHASAPLIRLDNTKAGMSKVDKAQVEAIINEASRGSPFYINEQRKAAARQKRVLAMRKKSAAFDANTSHTFRANIEATVDEMERRLLHCGLGGIGAGESTATTTTDVSSLFLGVYVHLDMDMFFAAVEEKRNPSLKHVPFGVGGMGMLSTTNYLAREYGVRAGMPGYIGKKLCPDLVFAHSGFDAYRQESAEVKSIVAEYDPSFSSGGLDELTMNLMPYLTRLEAEEGAATGVTQQQQHLEQGDTHETCTTRRLRHLLHKAATVAEEIRARVFERTQLTASCGIAATPCLAKIVANYKKPNGQYLLDAATHAEVMTFVHGLPVRTIPGIGKVSEEMLTESFGVESCADLYYQRYRLYYCVTPKLFEFLLQIGLGVMGSFGGFGESKPTTADQRQNDDDDGIEERETAADNDRNDTNAPRKREEDFDDATLDRKSISHERTFRAKLFAQELIAVAEKTLALSHELLVEEHLLTMQVGLKLKYTSFEVRQVSVPLSAPTQNLEVLQEAVMQLLSPFLHEFYSFRLLGVRLANLSVKPRDFDEGDPPHATVLVTSTAVASSRSPQHDKGRRDAPVPPINTLDRLFANHFGRGVKRERDEVVVAETNHGADGVVTAPLQHTQTSSRRPVNNRCDHSTKSRHPAIVYSLSSDESSDRDSCCADACASEDDVRCASVKDATTTDDNALRIGGVGRDSNIDCRVPAVSPLIPPLTQIDMTPDEELDVCQYPHLQEHPAASPETLAKMTIEEYFCRPVHFLPTRATRTLNPSVMSLSSSSTGSATSGSSVCILSAPNRGFPTQQRHFRPARQAPAGKTGTISSLDVVIIDDD